MVQLRRKAVEHSLAVGAGVATPLAIEVAGKGKRVKIGKARVKQSALVGGVVGGLALVAGATETGVRGEDADYAIEFGAGSLVTSVGLHLMSKPPKREARLQEEEITLQEEEELGFESGLEAGFGYEVKEY